MPGDQELCKRLRKEIEGQIQFQSFPLEIEDLQDIQTLQGIRMLSLGELSSIAFARKTQQAFLTDDQKARKLAEEFLGVTKVQTTPQLFGWLFFIGKLQDSEKNEIISEHSTLGRPLATFLEIMYIKALELRLAMESHGI